MGSGRHARVQSWDGAARSKLHSDLTPARLWNQLNGPLSQELAAIARRKFGAGDLIGVPFGTNAPRYAQTGVPTVVFGPGSIDQAHTVDEWVAVEQLEAAGETLYDFVLSHAW